MSADTATPIRIAAANPSPLNFIISPEAGSGAGCADSTGKTLLQREERWRRLGTKLGTGDTLMGTAEDKTKKLAAKRKMEKRYIRVIRWLLVEKKRHRLI